MDDIKGPVYCCELDFCNWSDALDSHRMLCLGGYDRVRWLATRWVRISGLTADEARELARQARHYYGNDVVTLVGHRPD